MTVDTDRIDNVDMDKILQRVKKLLNKAESCKEIGSLAEAEAFAEGAQKLLAKYKLDMFALEGIELEKKDPLGELHVDWKVNGVRHRRKRVAWIEWLAGHVARAHFCRIVVYSKSSSILLIGRKSDREVAEYVLTTLVHSAEDLAQKGYWKVRYEAQKRGDWNTNGYKAAFFYGFVNGIKEKYERIKRTQEENSKAMALVYVRSDKEVALYMKDTMKLGKATAVKGKANTSARGYAEGFNAGVNANTSANGIKGGEPSSTRHLTA